MKEDRLQSQRFELKYIVPERITETVREFVSSYLEVDEYGVGRPNYAYPNHSLYLDSEALTLYKDTINGVKNRYKLRIRFYDDKPESPIFFEIKRRMNEAILKQRGAVKREAAPLILAGHLPKAHHLLSDNPKQFVAVQRFAELMLMLRAKPKSHVAYLREAWVSPLDNSVRVTMDREVRAEERTTLSFGTEMSRPVRVFGNKVVLELKFTGRFPNWFGELVRVFGLHRGGAAKYAEGINLLGEHRVRSALQPWREVEERIPQNVTTSLGTGIMEDLV